MDAVGTTDCPQCGRRMRLKDCSPDEYCLTCEYRKIVGLNPDDITIMRVAIQQNAIREAVTKALRWALDTMDRNRRTSTVTPTLRIGPATEAEAYVAAKMALRTSEALSSAIAGSPEGEVERPNAQAGERPAQNHDGGGLDERGRGA